MNVILCLTILRSYQIACCKDVGWINRLLEAFQNLDACRADTPWHKLFSELAHPVMVGDASAVLEDLVSCCVFDLGVGVKRVS